MTSVERSSNYQAIIPKKLALANKLQVILMLLGKDRPFFRLFS